MSRASDGTYTQPLPAVVTGDPIEASWANTTVDDIETALTDSLSRSGNGNMSAALKVIAGTVSAPGLSFTSEANSGLYRAGAGDIRMALLGNELFRMTATGLRVADQNITMATAGKGIDFSANTGTAATGAATTSEILTWYEEGTWTPNLWDSSSSSSESQTYSIQQGAFTRIGRVLFFWGFMDLSSIGTLTGSQSAKIGPLPYSAAVSPAAYPVSFGTTAGLSLSGTYALCGSIAGGGNSIEVLAWSATTGNTNVTVTQLSTGGYSFSGSYIV